MQIFIVSTKSWLKTTTFVRQIERARIWKFERGKRITSSETYLRAEREMRGVVGERKERNRE